MFLTVLDFGYFSQFRRHKAVLFCNSLTISNISVTVGSVIGVVSYPEYKLQKNFIIEIYGLCLDKTDRFIIN